MTYPKTGNLAPAFAELSAIRLNCDNLREKAERVLDDIRPALIGQRVRCFRRIWQISQVRIGLSGAVTCYGVTVSKTGKVGTRGFDLGALEHCEFLP